MIPFIGLRYYHAQNEPRYQFKYIDKAFFRAMLQQVASSAYRCEGVVFWDWGTFGGPNYANDGTDVWSTSAPWYVATFVFFSAPADAGGPR